MQFQDSIQCKDGKYDMIQEFPAYLQIINKFKEKKKKLLVKII